MTQQVHACRIAIENLSDFKKMKLEISKEHDIIRCLSSTDCFYKNKRKEKKLPESLCTWYPAAAKINKIVTDFFEDSYRRPLNESTVADMASDQQRFRFYVNSS